MFSCKRSFIQRLLSQSCAPSTFVQHRLDVFSSIKLKQPTPVSKPIQIVLPNGNTVIGESHKTTPLDVAVGIAGEQFANKFVVARIDKTNLVDFQTPLDQDCSLEFLDFSSPEGKCVFWHSSAHVLGLALEQMFGAQLAFGPPIDEGGFFYDVDLLGK